MAETAKRQNQPEPVRAVVRQSATRVRWLMAGEAAIIILLALFVTQPYQNFNPNLVPTGREYLSAIQTHHLWDWVKTCGPCAFWNGAQRGGAPSFTDPYSSALHPLVMLTTLGWGVRTGAKIALVAIFMLGGLSQWWLAQVLCLGSLARLWSGMLAVVAGYLGARAENGNFGLLLSTVACALVLPPLILVAQGAGRRTAVVLGVLLALALLAGQGYMQIALACIAPLFLLLLPADRARRIAILQRLALAGAIAVLLASVFLVPLLHFLPEFSKYLDPAFHAKTSAALMPLFLVINNPDFYYGDALGKLPYPYLYANFVGWVPLAFVAWALFHHTAQQRRVVVILSLAAMLVLWIASGEPLQWLAERVPPLAGQFSGLRFHPVMAGMAVPPILALAAIGLDRLLDTRELRLHLALLQAGEQPRGIVFDPRILVLLPLLLALIQAYQFSSGWIRLVPLQDEVPAVLAALHTPDVQWINPPFGEHPFMEPALEAGLKMNQGFRTWDWKDRSLPPAVLEATRTSVKEDMKPLQTIDNIVIGAAPAGSEYAIVISPVAHRSVCTAQGVAGDINVQCNTQEGGTLTVKENSWNGWYASLDSRPADLLPGQWLSLDIPPGQHMISLHYRPWDTPLGLLMSLAGVGLAAWVWATGDKATK